MIKIVSIALVCAIISPSLSSCVKEHIIDNTTNSSNFTNKSKYNIETIISQINYLKGQNTNHSPVNVSTAFLNSLSKYKNKLSSTNPSNSNSKIEEILLRLSELSNNEDIINELVEMGIVEVAHKDLLVDFGNELFFFSYKPPIIKKYQDIFSNLGVYSNYESLFIAIWMINVPGYNIDEYGNVLDEDGNLV